MATQASRAIPVPPGSDPDDTPVEATIVLGGQPYIFEEGELSKAGPEFAEMALYETYRQIWQTFANYHGGRICPKTFRIQMTELGMGAQRLRDLIPHREAIIPNGHFVNIH